MFSATQKKDVLGIYTYWHISVFISSRFSFELLHWVKEVGICWVQGLGHIMDRQDMTSSLQGN
jgi:hypothetical protein